MRREAGRGTDDRQYKLIKRPQPRSGLSLKSHVHARTRTQQHTDSRPVLIDRWLPQQTESRDQHPRGLFLPDALGEWRNERVDVCVRARETEHSGVTKVGLGMH